MKVVLRLPDSWSNWNLEMLVLQERGKPEYREKNLSEKSREPTTNSTHKLRRRRDLNPGNIGGRRALSPLRHPLLPEQGMVKAQSLLLGHYFQNLAIIEQTCLWLSLFKII